MCPRPCLVLPCVHHHPRAIVAARFLVGLALRPAVSALAGVNAVLVILLLVERFLSLRGAKPVEGREKEARG